MLWMLGVAAILVDVISRFAGGGDGGAKPPGRQIVLSTPHPSVLDISNPAVDLTYVIINEKSNPEPLQFIESNGIAVAVPESNHDDKSVVILTGKMSTLHPVPAQALALEKAKIETSGEDEGKEKRVENVSIEEKGPTLEPQKDTRVGIHKMG